MPRATSTTDFRAFCFFIIKILATRTVPLNFLFHRLFPFNILYCVIEEGCLIIPFNIVVFIIVNHDCMRVYDPLIVGWGGGGGGRTLTIHPSHTVTVWHTHTSHTHTEPHLVTTPECEAARDRIFKLLRSPGIYSQESIPPAFVAWWAGTTTRFLLSS